MIADACGVVTGGHGTWQDCRVRWRPRRKRLLFVTGASGFLGRHLLPASEVGEWELLAPSSRILDVHDRDRVLAEITTWKPNAIVHLAYRKGDRGTIVDGSRHVAEAAAACGAHLIHLSTDLVFAGRPQPYSEHDRPDTTSVYGRWKAESETAVMTAHPSALTVRTSLLYGTTHLAPCQRDVDDAITGRSRMSFFEDEFRCPAHAADVAAALVTLADRPDVTGTLHIAGPNRISRAELAGAFARRLGGESARVRTSTLAASGVDRPGNLVLDVSRAASLGIQCRDVDTALH